MSAEKSLRDEFAMAALGGMLAATPAEVLCNPNLMRDKSHTLCELAYRQADALLAEREKRAAE